MKLKSIITLILISHFSFSQTVFNKMADFRKVSSPYPATVLTLGYYEKNDGGGGNWVFIDTSTKADNNGTVVKPNDVEGAGRYERVTFNDAVNVLWFGAKRNGTTDASAAIMAAINTSPAYSTTWSVPTFGHGRVIIPSGVYKMSNPIVIKTTVSLEGEGAGAFPYQEVQLRYDGNTSGIIILADTHNGGARSVTIKNLYLRNFGASTDSNANGLYTNTRVILDNVAFDNFGANGIAIVTNDSGNANNSYITNVSCYYNAKNGIFLSGNESNNIGIYSSSFNANGMCGVLDNSFLGNGYFLDHTSFNGVRNATGYSKSWCTYNGKVYQAIFYPSQKNIEPTVNPNWKKYWVENNTVFNTVSPAQWSQDSTYWITGSYVVSSVSATSGLFFCYSEGGQGANILNQFSTAWGGDHGAIFSSTDNMYLNATASQLQIKGAGIQIPDKDSIQTFSGLNSTLGIQWGSKKSGHSIFQLKYSEADRTANLYSDNSTNNLAFRIIGKGYDPAKLGLTVLPRTGMVQFPYFSGYWAGDVNNGNLSYNFVCSKTGPPTSGTWAVGTICVNTGLDSTVYGWKCILRGPPSQWQKIKTGN